MRGSPLWIASRIGILLAFGIMPLTRIRSTEHLLRWAEYHQQIEPYQEAFRYYISKADAAMERRDFKKADIWLKCAAYEKQKWFGIPTPK